MLKQWAQLGVVCLKYLDESGCCLQRACDYAYSPQGQQQGLLLFFLPPYSPQMNRIEDEWLQLKRTELASRVFDDEVDLADAIIEGIENRGRNGGYSIERFKFN